jgi:hypothetical protein
MPELEAMTDEERRASFDASLVLDPATDPRVTNDPRMRALLDRAAAWTAARIAAEQPATD